MIADGAVLAVLRTCLYVLLCFSAVLLIGDRLLQVKGSKPRRSDVIIVLGYPANADGGPSDVMLSRVDKGVELYKQGYAPWLLLSGGGQPVESEIMAVLAQESNVSPDRILQDSESKTTKENARKSGDIMRAHNWRTAIVVTSPYHTQRASSIFSDLGIDAVVVSSQPSSELSLGRRISSILHEILSYVGDAFQP